MMNQAKSHRRTDPRIDMVRRWLHDFAQLERRNCTRVEWIMLKLSCKPLVAERLIDAVEREP